MESFCELLEIATGRVPEEYFQLPIDGRDDPVYRERVYCYELYHQLRVLWPDESQYSLGGEVDKAGHPLIRDNGLDNCKPDFLVHIPGNMGGNFAVVEVKPIRSSRQAVQKDIETLANFVTHAQYEKAIYLFYGNPDHGRGLELASEEVEAQVAVDIELWHHPAPGDQAVRIR